MKMDIVLLTILPILLVTTRVSAHLSIITVNLIILIFQPISMLKTKSKET